MCHFDEHINNVLNNEQHGFRKGPSCETQLALTVNDLARSLDNKGQVDVIITDFSKAFDLVPHQRLLSKLKHAGISGSLHDWVSTFLTKISTSSSRRQLIQLNPSTSIVVTSGVLQGVLGPLLFILYLNDFPKGISSQVRLLADDCILYREVQTQEDSCKLQNDIDILCNWESRWQMRFNVAKCYAMHMTLKRKPLVSSYKMNSSFLQTVTKHTYLGVEINNKLNWAEHISISTSKANKVLGLMRRNLFRCSAEVKETAYKTLVRPKMEYCATKINWKLSNAEQRRAASSVSSIITNLVWKSLEERRTISRLTLLYRSIHHKVAINVDRCQVYSEEGKISTRKSSSTYRYSFLPRTIILYVRGPSL